MTQGAGVRRRHPAGPGRGWLRLAALALCLAPSPLLAQDHADRPATVQVSLAGYTLVPALAEDGTPLLDDASEVVILRLPLEDSVITPGDRVLYVITLDNPTDIPARALTLTTQVAAELVLDPFSLSGPDGLVADWADAENPDQFRPIFQDIDGTLTLTADLDALRGLRLTLAELPPARHSRVEYTATLR